MLATALLLAISIGASLAQTAGDYRSAGNGNWDLLGTWEIFNGTWATPTVVEGWAGQNPGTGAVTIQAGDNVTISIDLTTKPLGTVTINGDLTFSGDWIFKLNTMQLIVTQGLIPVAKIKFETKSELKLPVGATIYVIDGGLIGACNNNTHISIGLLLFTCQGNGGGSNGNFPDLYTPTITTTTPSTICGAGTVILGAVSSGGGTITWWDSSTGGNLLAPGNNFTTPLISTTTTYYAEAKNPITGYLSDPRTAVIATINTIPTLALTSAASTDAQSTCINTAIIPITYSTTGATGVTLTGLPTGVNGSWNANLVTISGTPTVAGAALTYTVTLTGGCGNTTTTGTLTVSADNTVTLSSASGTDAQTTCINTAITPITYSTVGATGATVTGLPTGVNGSWAANVVTISGTPTVAGPALTYTVTLTGGCGSGTSAGTITVTPSGTLAFALGSTSSRTQSAQTIIYTAIATNTTTATTYALSPASAAETFNTSTGELKYSSLWNGTCIITATATGCNGIITETHTVSANWCYALFTVNGALSCAGASSIDGHIGTLVGATTGFTPPLNTPPGYSGPGILTPSSRLDPQATPNSVSAAAQVVTAYNDLAAIPCGPTTAVITLAGPATLAPNVYCYSGALTTSGNIILNGGPNDVFIFKINGALTTDIGSTITMGGTADYHNVYWRVAGAVVLNGTEFTGTIVNNGAITLHTGAKLNGRALSINGAIALTTNVVKSECYPLISLPNNTIPTFVPPGDLTACVENLTSAVYNSTTIDIDPVRPDFYTFLLGDKRLDLEPANFIDNPDVLGCPFTIRWKIDMKDGTHIPAIAPFYNTGQPSAYADIKFLGDGIGNGSSFADVIHTITYWIVDCAGKESLPQTRTITIKPRPYIKKMTL